MRLRVLFILLLAIQLVNAQETKKDVIYLKNGSIIKGEIVELQPEKSVRVRTADGKEFEFAMTEVDRIGKESGPASSTVASAPSSSSSRGVYFLLNGGASLPVGPFKRTDTQDGGGAKTGFAVAAELVIPLGGPFHLEFGGQYGLNPFNIEAIPTSSGVNVNVTRWTCIWALGGLGIGTNGGSGFEFDITPLAGVLFARSPEINVSAFGTSYMNWPEMKTSKFAFGGSARFILGPIVLGARYLNSTPKFEATTTSGGVTTTGGFEQKIEMVVVYIGFAI